MGVYRLRMRNVESLTYFGQVSPDGNSDGLGWHDDFGSYITMVVMLSRLGEYSGGGFEVENIDRVRVESRRLDRGEVMAWKSWRPHGVRPVTRGKRHVLVIEFWDQEEQLGEKLVHRQGENPDIFQYCLNVQRASKGKYNFKHCWGFNSPEQIAA